MANCNNLNVRNKMTVFNYILNKSKILCFTNHLDTSNLGNVSIINSSLLYFAVKHLKYTNGK